MDLIRCNREGAQSSCSGELSEKLLVMEENGSGKDKLMDLTRCNRDGLLLMSWGCFVFSVLRLDVIKIVPIMRFKKQKRTVGVNQLATDSIMVS